MAACRGRSTRDPAPRCVGAAEPAATAAAPDVGCGHPQTANSGVVDRACRNHRPADLALPVRSHCRDRSAHGRSPRSDAGRHHARWSRHPQGEVRQDQAGRAAPDELGFVEHLPQGPAQGDDPGSAPVRDCNGPDAGPGYCKHRVPQARRTDEPAQTRGGPGTNRAVATTLVCHAVAGGPGPRRQTGPAHAGSGHLSRTRRCHQFLL